MTNRTRNLAALCASLALFAGCAQHPYPGETASQRPADSYETRESARRAHAGTFDRTEAPDEWVFVERDGLVRNERGELAGGQLCARRGDDVVVPVPLEHTSVRGDVTLQVASVDVVQHYQNVYDEKIEAVYVFPLPQDAAVTDFVMEFGGRRIRGVIREKEEARELYDRAKHAGHVASLMTQSRPNLFTQAVANIEPGARVDVRVTYFQALGHEAGEFELRVPLVVGPRYDDLRGPDGVGAIARNVPGGREADVAYLAPREVTAARVSLEFDVDAGIPIESVSSPTHPVVVDRDGETRARVRLRDGDAYPNRDFVLRYRLAQDRVRAGIARHATDRGEYVALFLQPSERPGLGPRSPLEVVFVVDASSSMSGAPMEAARRAIHGILDRLDERDCFQVIAFDANVTRFARASVQATALNVQDGRDFVDGLRAVGSTVMHKGMSAALETNRYGDYRTIHVFLTDGFIGDEAEVLGLIDERIGDARIFSFGVSSAPNTYLLERMAELGRGTSAYIDPSQSVDPEVDRFFARLERPILSDLEIDWGGARVAEVYPSRLPDLVPGRPVMITARIVGRGPESIVVTARAGDRRVQQELAWIDGRDHAALETLWARAKIREYEDRALRANGDWSTAAVVRETALDHGLLSRYTGFVAVDASGRTVGDHGTTVRVPVPVPAGVRYDTTVTR